MTAALRNRTGGVGRITLVGLAGLIMAALTGAGAGPAQANDGYAETGAGGLVFVEAPAGLHMAREDLTIAADRIRVAYRFENRSGRPIEALVAFPLPDIAPADPHEALGTPPSEVAVLPFRTEVDGRPVRYQTERRAFACQGGGWIDTGAAEQRCCADYDWETQACTPAQGTPEVTDTLARLGLLDVLDAEPVQARLNALPPAALDDLVRLGAVRLFGPDVTANWVQRIRHYRTQVFPADRPLEVVHTYQPVPGASVWGPSDIGGWGTVWAVRYVLNTAGTWTGPIERFSLTIEPHEAPDREVIVVAGLDDLRRDSDGRVRTEITNFAPRRDIVVTWFPSATPEARHTGSEAYLMYAYGAWPGMTEPFWISPNAWGLPPGRFPGASVRPITAQELEQIGTEELAEMRNEIFARHGYVFKTERWSRHFQAADWYRPRPGQTVTLTPVEQANVAVIKATETARP
jgi:hypothetical protein